MNKSVVLVLLSVILVGAIFTSGSTLTSAEEKGEDPALVFSYDDCMYNDGVMAYAEEHREVNTTAMFGMNSHATLLTEENMTQLSEWGFELGTHSPLHTTPREIDLHEDAESDENSVRLSHHKVAHVLQRAVNYDEHGHFDFVGAGWHLDDSRFPEGYTYEFNIVDTETGESEVISVNEGYLYDDDPRMVQVNFTEPLENSYSSDTSYIQLTVEQKHDMYWRTRKFLMDVGVNPGDGLHYNYPWHDHTDENHNILSQHRSSIQVTSPSSYSEGDSLDYPIERDWLSRGRLSWSDEETQDYLDEIAEDNNLGIIYGYPRGTPGGEIEEIVQWARDRDIEILNMTEALERFAYNFETNSNVLFRPDHDIDFGDEKELHPTEWQVDVDQDWANISLKEFKGEGERIKWVEESTKHSEVSYNIDDLPVEAEKIVLYKNGEEYLKTEDSSISFTSTGKNNIFEIKSKTIEVEVNIEGNGKVVEPGEGNVYLAPGDNQFKAEPDEEEKFIHWEWEKDGKISQSTEKETNITIEEDGEIIAIFTEHDLVVDIQGEGAVDIEPSQKSFYEGQEVQLTAESAEGHEFVEWTGDYTGTEEQITLTMDEDKSVTASFEQHEYTLEVDVEGEGTVDIEPDKEEYEPGTEVDLTATADEHWYFVEWTGDYSGTEEEITVTMDGDKSVTAWFEQHEYTLEVDVEGEGTVDIEPDRTSYEPGTEVDLTAIADEDWYFVEWTGDYQSDEAEINVTMEEDMEIKATFEEETLSPWWYSLIFLVIGIVIIGIYLIKSRFEYEDESALEEDEEVKTKSGLKDTEESKELSEKEITEDGETGEEKQVETKTLHCMNCNKYTDHEEASPVGKRWKCKECGSTRHS